MTTTTEFGTKEICSGMRVNVTKALQGLGIGCVRSVWDVLVWRVATGVYIVASGDSLRIRDNQEAPLMLEEAVEKVCQISTW